MFWNALAVVYGAFVALFPERTLEYLTRIVLVGYENPEELEPSEWYVSLTRIDGVLLAAAGLLAIAFERGCSKGESGSDDDTDE
jgi:hypothetical protein